MKKMVFGILASVMVLSIGGISAFAAGPGTMQRGAASNRNGTCDCPRTTCNSLNSDSCNMYSTSQNGGGKNFIDLDGDGICDHAPIGQGTGQGQGQGFRGGRNRS